MTEEPNAAAVPGVCEVCAASPLHHPLDRQGDSVFCPHREVWALRHPPGVWLLLRGITQARYDQTMDGAARDATLLTEAGLGYSCDRGVYRLPVDTEEPEA